MIRLWKFFTISSNQQTETEAVCFGLPLQQMIGRQVRNKHLSKLIGTIDHFGQYSFEVDDSKWRVSVHAPASMNEFFHNMPMNEFMKNWELID
jgi:hypothetical protein